MRRVEGADSLTLPHKIDAQRTKALFPMGARAIQAKEKMR